MIADFDKDKQEAQERCERTYQGFHEAGKAKLREELQVEMAYLQEQCEKKLDFLRKELEKCKQELDDVRQSYIMICKEKDNLEQQLDTSTQTECGRGASAHSLCRINDSAVREPRHRVPSPRCLTNGLLPFCWVCLRSASIATFHKDHLVSTLS
uniref:Uncharacterized protein n=1 Tax=Eptatretus burgeri TaxID=7764 RepID=A0A8C4R5A1_EPTBU